MRLAALLLLGLSAAAPARPEEKLDLNRARTDQLEALPGIGPTAALRIVRMRERNGPYRCIEELRAAPRLTEAQFETLRSRLRVDRPDPRCKDQETARRAGKPVEPR